MATAFQVTFDCADPARLAEFWAAVLGYQQQAPPAGYQTWAAWLEAQHIPQEHWNATNAVVDPAGLGPRIFFQRVPEPKTVKNRVHLDVNVGGGADTSRDERRARVDREVERIVTLGATKLRVVEERGEYWVVMTDPEGNEFCLQ